MNNKIYLTELVCLKCGNIDIIQRLKKRSKEIGHIKDLWCFKCKSETKHYEIIDKSLFYYSYLNDLNALYVKSLLWPDEFKVKSKIKKIEK